ncbi:hypothetical protein [Bacillus velezensis]|nr:hypothetical protein MF619_000001 [Bacillus velezensis]
MKIFRRIVIVLCLLLIPSYSAFAASFGSGAYDSSLDSYVVPVNGEGATSLRVSGFKSGSSSPFWSATYNVGDSGNLTINCNAEFKTDLLDASGSVMTSQKYTVTQVKNQRGACKEAADKDGGSSGGSSGGGSSSDCSDAVCKCIGTLKGVNEGISQKMDESLGNQKKIKEAVDNVNESTKAVKGAVDDLKDQFTSDKDYSFDDPPGYKLTDYKPDLPDTPFKDTNTYFKDNGDDSSDDMSKLPQAPEPKDWDGVKKQKELKKDKEQQKDDELKKDREKKKDDELQRDEFKKDREQKKDDELKKDQFKKDKEQKKDGELKKDQFKKDAEQRKDGELSKDKELTKDKYAKDSEMHKDRQMEPDRQMQKSYQLQEDQELKKDKF